MLGAEAVKLYSQAIVGAPSDAALYSNRSAVHLALGAKEEAHQDAVMATEAGPDWPKGYYRCMQP